jgi:hypothetical protein
MGGTTGSTGTRTAVTGGERDFLPGMRHRWLLPLYDPFTRLAGVGPSTGDCSTRPASGPASASWSSAAAPATCCSPPSGPSPRRSSSDSTPTSPRSPAPTARPAAAG